MRNISNKHAELADEGWGNTYYHVIPNIINNHEVKNFVELGVAFGGHAAKILEQTGIEKYVGIDNYHLTKETTDSFYHDGIPYTQQDYDNLYIFTNERLGKFGNRAELLRKSCIEALIDFEDESLDMVFIDANHSFDRVKEDIENWSKKVRKGGIVSGHDYNHPNFPGVTVVVNDWTQKNKYKLNIEDGHVWWIVK